MAKLLIGKVDGSKLWMETFSTHNSLIEEVLLRAKIEYFNPDIPFRSAKVYHGSVDRLTIDQIENWFNGVEGFDSAMNYADNARWILITKETE